MKPTKIEKWAVVNFSARCDLKGLVRDLIKCGEMKGIVSFAITHNSIQVTQYFIYLITCILFFLFHSSPFGRA